MQVGPSPLVIVVAGPNGAGKTTTAPRLLQGALLVFLSLPSPDLAVARVAERVRLGGHNVPEAVIRRRFASGLRNFFDLYQHVVDSWQLYDNADLRWPRLLASRDVGPPRGIRSRRLG
ncbi:MAG TPA: hypothetical protein VFE37_03280 [Chloroflexota bacterium]|nr:hypothetical protein [Chloroflexota bacterium]